MTALETWGVIALCVVVPGALAFGISTWFRGLPPGLLDRLPEDDE